MSNELPPPPYPPDTRAKGWRFEIDYERIEQSDTWPLAQEIPMAQHALLMMWMMAWATQVPCGSFPDDETAIRAKCRIPPAHWSKMREVLMRGWWKASDGRLYHDTLTKRVHEMMKKRRSDSDRQAERRAREAAESDASHAAVTRDTTVTPHGVRPESSTDHRPPSSEAKASSERSPKARGTKKSPLDFQPVDPEAWIGEHCPGLDWKRETERFRDYTFRTAITDWAGAWRNWMRRAYDNRMARGESLSFRERDAANASARVSEMTGGLAAAGCRRAEFAMETFDESAPRRLD